MSIILHSTCSQQCPHGNLSGCNADITNKMNTELVAICICNDTSCYTYIRHFFVKHASVVRAMKIHQKRTI